MASYESGLNRVSTHSLEPGERVRFETVIADYWLTIDNYEERTGRILRGGIVDTRVDAMIRDPLYAVNGVACKLLGSLSIDLADSGGLGYIEVGKEVWLTLFPATNVSQTYVTPIVTGIIVLPRRTGY